MLIKATGSQVHYHRGKFQWLGDRLREIGQILKNSIDSQVPLNEGINKCLTELTELATEVQKIDQDIEKTRSELQCKQRDIQLLSGIRKDLTHTTEKCKLLQDKNQLLQEIANDKKTEIERLKEELQKKEYQLQSVQQKAEAMKSEKDKLQVELQKKHEEVNALQKEKEELTRSYNDEREKAEKLFQKIYALKSDKDEMKVR